MSATETYHNLKMVEHHKSKIQERRAKPVGSLQQALDTNPKAEINMWVIVAIIGLLGFFITPLSLILTIPLAVFCFIERQQSAKRKKLADQDAMKARYEALDAPTVPIPFLRQERGKHAAA